MTKVEKIDAALPAVRPGTPGRPIGRRYREQYGIIIVCPDEARQRSMFEALRALVDCKLKVVVT